MQNAKPHTARDFKYRELIFKPKPWSALMSALPAFRSGCLRDCVDAFRANLERMATFAMLPTEFAFQIRRDSLFYTNAVFRAEGRADLSIEDLEQMDLSDAVMKHIMDQFNLFEALPFERQVKLRESLGLPYVETLLTVSPEMMASMDALFGSIILSAWTAFECLAADAWAACVNYGPIGIRHRVMLSRQIKKQEDTGIAEMLADLDYDPTERFGEFLIQARMVSFQTLPNIMKYYGVIFEKETMKLFAKHNNYIEALSAVRNILTHKGGRADKQFLNKTSSFPEFSSAKQDDAFLLNGELVKKLRDTAAIVGLALLEAVDELITPVPKTP